MTARRSARVKLLTRAAAGAAAIMLAQAAAASPLATLDRYGSKVAIEPYAPNIVRVTLSLEKEKADAAPGYGVIAKPDATGWTHRIENGADVFASSALTLTVAAAPQPRAPTQMSAISPRRSRPSR